MHLSHPESFKPNRKHSQGIFMPYVAKCCFHLSMNLNRISILRTMHSMFRSHYGKFVVQQDVMVPGTGILAAMIPKSSEQGSVPIGKKPSLFGIKSAASMACPHVTAAVALIKSDMKNGVLQ